jgi:hypothetical protein
MASSSAMASSSRGGAGLTGALFGALLVALSACSSSSKPLDIDPDPGSGNPFTNGEDGLGAGLSDAEDGDGFDGSGACAGQNASAEVSAAVLQLIVDTSGSMDQDAPGATQGSKWQATRRALLSAVEEMPGRTAVGVIFYPDVSDDVDATGPSNNCFDRQADVAIGPLDTQNSAQRRQIQTAFQAQSPNGGTPTHDAYDFGVRTLEATTAPGARFAVVITDGTPTYSLGCVGTGLISDPVDPTPLVGAAQQFFKDGVRTFVIGSPGSEDARESLSRMAEAGGTASPGCSHRGPNYCHFDMTRAPDFAVALSGALGQIAGLALSCNYDIPTPPNGGMLDAAKVNVLYRPLGGDQELIRKNTAATCSEGWEYSEDQKQVLLCGSTCDRLRESNGTVTLQFGCSTQIR